MSGAPEGMSRRQVREAALTAMLAGSTTDSDRKRHEWVQQVRAKVRVLFTNMGDNKDNRH